MQPARVNLVPRVTAVLLERKVCVGYTGVRDDLLPKARVGRSKKRRNEVRNPLIDIWMLVRTTTCAEGHILGVVDLAGKGNKTLGSSARSADRCYGGYGAVSTPFPPVSTS